MKKERAALFIDGVFFTKINEAIRECYNYKNIVIKNFIELIVKEIEAQEQTKIKIKQAEFFKGKFSVNQLNEIYKKDESKISQYLLNERKLEDILHLNNISIHNHQSSIRKNGNLVEKGIDVSIAVEAMNLEDVDYFILISGDADFVPLIRSLKRKGIRTATIEVNLKTKSGNTIKTSNNAIPVYDIVINLSDLLKDESKLSLILNM